MSYFKVNKKETAYFALMATISVLTYIALFFNKMLPSLLFYLIVLLIIRLFSQMFFFGHIKGNAIKVNRDQFPEMFEVLKKQAKKLQLSKTPEMYVLQGDGVLNAFATRALKRNIVILHSDIFEMAYEGEKNAISFIIGHELGHIKRNHLHFLKTILTAPAMLVPFLQNAYSRACEYTCDSFGYTLCPEGATKGLLLLAAGKKLINKVNLSPLTSNRLDGDFSAWLAEIFSTHPHTLKRIAAINKLKEQEEGPF